MSDYTPTTEEVRIKYSMDEKYCDEVIEAKWAAEFDRWLAAHDAEIRRIAFVEIVNGVNLIDVCEQDAYRRGREDAAKAIEEGNSCYTTNHATGWDLFCREHAIVAARGSEQA